MRKGTIVCLFIIFCSLARHSCAETIDVTIERLRYNQKRSNLWDISYCRLCCEDL